LSAAAPGNEENSTFVSPDPPLEPSLTNPIDGHDTRDVQLDDFGFDINQPRIADWAAESAHLVPMSYAPLPSVRVERTPSPKKKVNRQPATPTRAMARGHSPPPGYTWEDIEDSLRDQNDTIDRRIRGIMKTQQRDYDKLSAVIDENQTDNRHGLEDVRNSVATLEDTMGTRWNGLDKRMTASDETLAAILSRLDELAQTLRTDPKGTPPEVPPPALTSGSASQETTRSIGTTGNDGFRTPAMNTRFDRPPMTGGQSVYETPMTHVREPSPTRVRVKEPPTFMGSPTPPTKGNPGSGGDGPGAGSHGLGQTVPRSRDGVLMQMDVNTLPKYDGDPRELLSFLVTVRRLMPHMHAGSMDELVVNNSRFRFLFEGAVLEWYDSEVYSQPFEDWPDFVARISAEYLGPQWRRRYTDLIKFLKQEDPDQPISAWYNKLRLMVEIAKIGRPAKEVEMALVNHMLVNVHECYRTACHVFHKMGLSSTEIKTQLTEMEGVNRTAKQQDRLMVPLELTTRPIKFASAGTVGQAYRSAVDKILGRDIPVEVPISAYQPRSFNGACRRCKEVGHMVRDCPVPYCYVCRTVGHKNDECEFVVVSRADAEANQIKPRPVNIAFLNDDMDDGEAGNGLGDRL
jgi:hypothetical protein